VGVAADGLTLAFLLKGSLQWRSLVV